MGSDSNEQSPGTDRTRLDATGEFFSVGAPLHAVRAGYVQRAADDVLYETLVAGRYAHVIAPDRSGKSSLVAATSARLENNGFKVAILDLEQIGDRDAGTDAGRWYYSVAYRLLRQLRIRVDLQSWWQDKSILSNCQRLVEFYSEIVLRNVHERVVVFIDEIQSMESLPFADQLLASIRVAHNARATDPEFSRLSFALLGECDPLSLIGEPEMSPFNVTQPVSLGDFTRTDLDLFVTEVNLPAEAATTALDRVYYWTSGQPYLTQKLLRAISRDAMDGDVIEEVDRLATQQLANRAALHSEPQMSHIHRAIVGDEKRREALLTIYGRVRKGIHVPADLGSPLHRRLLAVGLLVIDEEGNLAVRNRLYGAVFTARWANENLPTQWRTPAAAAAIILLIAAVPFWYTQLLPRSYVDVLTSDTVELEVARDAYTNLRSFPGHTESADKLFRRFLEQRARIARSEQEIVAVAGLAADLPDAGRLPEELLAGYWDAIVREARQLERRDEALIASLQSLVLSTPKRRGRSAMLVGDDYPLLLASLGAEERGSVTFDPDNMLLTEIRDATVLQWSLEADGLAAQDSWQITALEVAPVVRRVIVDRAGTVSRASLTINISHARAADLRIKVIAPSGRAVEVDPGVERASAIDDLRIPSSQLGELIGESLSGTWSLSIRDEELGVAGRLVGWNLSLNSQGLVEDFQRGLNISDPEERESDNIWVSPDGRFAVVRAQQSDSARVWDLAFGKPIRAIAVNELEQPIGVSNGARYLVTATQDTVNLWNTGTGRRDASLPVGAASSSAALTADGTQLFVQRRRETDTTFELWSLDSKEIVAQLETAGTPALVAHDPTGQRVATADYDRAVRVWDLSAGSLVAQIDLASQPSEISLASGGDVLGTVFAGDGVALWRIDMPTDPLVEEYGFGQWQLEFSPTGTLALVGRLEQGPRVVSTLDGRPLGPPLGSGVAPARQKLLAFSRDEQVVVTGGPASVARFWRIPTIPAIDPWNGGDPAKQVWSPAGDAVTVATPDAGQLIFGDPAGNVHIVPADVGREGLHERAEELTFYGHNAEVRHIVVSSDGRLAASAAADNTVRVWNTDDGLPRQFIAEIPGGPVDRLAFGPSGSKLAVLTGLQVQLYDTETGVLMSTIDLGEVHSAMSFAADGRLYLGSATGALHVAAPGPGGDWTMQTLWKGSAGIRWLEASPDARFLVLVDTGNLAQLFSLAEGRIGERTMQIPSTVDEVTFASGGLRILFRTPNWAHLASASASGLVWLDSILVPKALAGSRIVFGNTGIDEAAALGTRFYLPVAGNGYPRLTEISFATSNMPGLFGNREELLDEWSRKLAFVPTQGPDE